MDVVGDGCDDPVHHMHDAIGGVLVRFDQPGAVHCHNLQEAADRGSRRAISTIGGWGCGCPSGRSTGVLMFTSVVVQVYKCAGAHPVAVVVHVHVKVLVHGGEGGAVAEFFGGQPLRHHVVVQGVEQLDVHIAHKSIQDLLHAHTHAHKHRNTHSVSAFTCRAKLMIRFSREFGVIISFPG